MGISNLWEWNLIVGEGESTGNWSPAQELSQPSTGSGSFCPSTMSLHLSHPLTSAVIID